MSMNFAFALVNGLTTAMAVFIVATGLTLVYGVLRVLNFAHGAFFMIGAYVGFSVIGQNTSLPILVLASLAGGLVVGALGFVTDTVVFKRLRGVDEHLMLIATFALLMVCSGMVKLIWGLDFHSVAPPDELSGLLMLGPLPLPVYSACVIVVGVLLYVLLDVFLGRMWIGKLVRSVALDPWMAQLCGVRVPLVYTGAVVFSFFLAGFAGGVLLPNQSLSPTLADTYLLQGFVVVIIGGLGDVRGAFLASILLGVIDSVNSVVLPNLPGVAIYVAMILVLLWRPDGLLRTRPV